MDSAIVSDEERTRTRREVTGVILVGGKSRRMGRDKAFLELAGRTLFERVLEAFQSCFDRVILVGDRAERFTSYDLPIFPDIYPGCSLGGLYTGLSHAQTPFVFVSSCDMAFPSVGIIEALCTRADGYDVVVPNVSHGYEPLFALYNRSCLPIIERQLLASRTCVFDFYPEVKVCAVAEEELLKLDPSGRAFLNLNTPEEYETIIKEMKS